MIFKKKDIVKEKLLELGYNIIPSNSNAFNYAIENEKYAILIKVVPFYLGNELIVTNKHYWCINSDYKNYNRSKKPVLVKGVKEFDNVTYNTNKNVIKLGIITPGCYNKTMYINECDVIKISINTNCYGFKIITIDELEALLDLYK